MRLNIVNALLILMAGCAVAAPTHDSRGQGKAAPAPAPAVVGCDGRNVNNVEATQIDFTAVDFGSTVNKVYTDAADNKVYDDGKTPSLPRSESTH
ncbi:hypothetical protein GMORB2_2328 [Geosmithia morbida]|uniref:Uncharacterized protein n=1 Tax=Geosmithia morbida TaxID=1094350 RepID=A0A9P5D2D4_9HYPO|nr:uncharacterized protein GMORB2_2328 [Geosmithia morbida]KAF4121366.1 hypothetical protein GMORB2_2328 [Geosmithia morbida]